MLTFDGWIFEQGFQVISCHTILQVLKMPVIAVIITLIAFNLVGPWSFIHQSFLT